ncbi:hypothetical protein [Luteipulveratus mongoliensis]|uniref:Uncharacterized protein n=1 Tax=Luteipulveratus mongoliensis TaxID=571913 RepID=A0A0K1JG11_9MICO|nr:hypothetical protein [Luteipulveratus mongoliensis]AKU15535.1 hypothetical protein VV02_06140 [Luteipulveratus mongoliensis]
MPDDNIHSMYDRQTTWVEPWGYEDLGYDEGPTRSYGSGSYGASSYGGSSYDSGSYGAGPGSRSEPLSYDDLMPEPDGVRGRLTQLSLVDGRVVDITSGPVAGTRFLEYADEHDREIRRLADQRLRRMAPPPEPYEVMLGWLDGLVGGRANLEALDTATLSPAAPDLGLADRTAFQRQVVVSVAEHLDRVADRWFDDEVRSALHGALSAVLTHHAVRVLTAKSPEHAAGALCWAVGKANDLLGQGKVVTQTAVAEQLGLGSLSSGGSQMAESIRGLKPQGAHRPHLLSCPDLLALARPELLVARTRAQIIGWRDQALAAQAEHRAQGGMCSSCRREAALNTTD